MNIALEALMKILANARMFPATVKKWRNPNVMDSECISLCKAINPFRGIETVESCCGHGERPFHIWFLADNLEVLPPLLYWFAHCHCGFWGWQVIVRTDCAMRPVSFLIEGPTGSPAYAQADQIADLITNEHRL